MSMAMPALRSPACYPDAGTTLSQPATVRVTRTLILSCLLSLIFVTEYEQAGGTAAKSILYDALPGGFRLIDLLVLCLGLAHGFALGCSRRRVRRFPRRLMALLAAFAMAIAIALVYGFQRGGRNFFFDWRALALGVAFYFMYRFWIQDLPNVRTAIIAFGLVVSIQMATLFYSYLRGQGDSLLGMRIPLFDGPAISALVFGALFGLSLFAGAPPTRRRWPWLLLSAGATLLVALCFRRTYWAELVLGVALLAISSQGRRLNILGLPLCMIVVAFALLGTSFSQRLASIDFTRDDAPYGQDNADHVGDVLDAWTQVRAAPVMGIGLGTAYPTWHIRNWKEESVMVHNAPLHVWLKYGLLGLAIYLVYHLSLFRCLWMHAKRSPPRHRAMVNAILAYLAAQFIVSLGFTPWPYSAVQSTNLIAFLLAIAFVRKPLCHSLESPSSLRPSTAPLTWKTLSSA
jgi:hypothetical protein